MEAFYYITKGGKFLDNNFYIPSQKIVIRRSTGNAFRLLEDPATLAEAQQIIDENKYGRVINLDKELCDKLVSYGRAMNQAEARLQEAKTEVEKSAAELQNSAETLVELALAAGKKSS